MIDHTKVLLIINSNPAQIALSQGVANWYAVRRQLTDSTGNYYWISADFGTAICANSPTLGNSRAMPVSTVATSVPVPTTLQVNIDELVISGKSSKVIQGTVGVTRLMELIATLATLQQVQVLLVTPGVPLAICGPYQVTNVWRSQPTEIYLAAATILNPAPPTNRTLDTELPLEPEGTLYTYPGVSLNSTNAFVRSPHRPPQTWLGNPPRRLAYGRIGFADQFFGGEYSPLGVTDFGVGTVKGIVNNAIKAETENNYIKPHLVGGASYPAGMSQPNTPFTGWGLGEWAAYANNIAAAFGCTDLHYLNVYTKYHIGSPVPTNADVDFQVSLAREDLPAGTQYVKTTTEYPIGLRRSVHFPGYTLPGQNYMMGIYGGDSFSVYINEGLEAAVPAGTPMFSNFQWSYADPPVAREWFAFVIQEGSQNLPDYAPGGNFDNKTKFAPGAWCLLWQSSARLAGYLNLRSGGSLGFCNIDEPTIAGLPKTHVLTALLMSGMPAAEAIYRSGKTFTSAWGDPLYAPYARNKYLFTHSFFQD